MEGRWNCGAILTSRGLPDFCLRTKLVFSIVCYAPWARLNPQFNHRHNGPHPVIGPEAHGTADRRHLLTACWRPIPRPARFVGGCFTRIQEEASYGKSPSCGTYSNRKNESYENTCDY